MLRQAHSPDGGPGAPAADGTVHSDDIHALYSDLDDVDMIEVSFPRLSSRPSLHSPPSKSTSSTSGVTKTQVSITPLAHTHQSLTSLTVATQATIINTSSAAITLSVLVRPSTTAPKSLDALIVIHDALARPLMASFSVYLVVDKAPSVVADEVRAVRFRQLAKTLGPFSAPMSVKPLSAPGVIPVVCDCQSLFSDRPSEYKIKSINVTMQHSTVLESPTVALSTHQLALLSTLDDPDLSDCALLPKDSVEPIHVSRAILAQASPYFKTMFRGPWAETMAQPGQPIAFGWSTVALVICLLHAYSGGTWLPHHHMPNAMAVEALVAKMQMQLPMREFMTRHLWNEVIDLAMMLEQFDLAKVANQQLIQLLEVEQGTLAKEAKSFESKLRSSLMSS